MGGSIAPGRFGTAQVEAGISAVGSQMVKQAPGSADLREDLAQAHYQLGVRHLKEERPDDFLDRRRFRFRIPV